MPEVKDEKELEEIIFNLGIKNSQLMTGSRIELESYPNPYQPEMRLFGGLPHYRNKDNIISHLPGELAYFNVDMITDDAAAKKDLTRSAENLLFYEMKSGQKLSELSEEVLAHYPDQQKQGKVINLFGLSGCGKSTALSAMREKFGGDIVVMDNDTARYNLLAETVAAADPDLTPDQLRASKLIHNRITGSYYQSLNHITNALKHRGYTVIRAAVTPFKESDVSFYLQHPDGINPVVLLEADHQKLHSIAENLAARTSARVPGLDDYDWAHPHRVTKFEDMVDVTVQVPVSVHENFLYIIGKQLQDNPDKYHTLHNQKASSPEEAQANLVSQLEQYI